MIDGNTSVSLAIVCSIIAAVGVGYTLISNLKKNNSEEASGIAKANAKLDQLCTMMTETRVDIKSMESKINDLGKKQIEHEVRISNNEARLTKVEKKVEDL